MAKKKKKTSNHKKKIGQVPGSIIYTGHKASPLSIELFEYDSESLNEAHYKTVTEIFDIKDTKATAWININGLNQVEAIDQIGRHFDIHPLILEDIVNTSQRPKIDELNDYVFIVLKMLYYDPYGDVTSEQVSFILGENYVLSFQEAEGDVFDSVRDRIKNSKGRIRNLKADYLLYALIDAVTDHYYDLIETLGDKIESLEDTLFNGNAQETTSQQIQDLKREILKVRRAIFPLREITNRIDRTSHKLIAQDTIHFFRDVHDHIIQITENIDVYREMIWGLMDMYMTSISNKMNEVMKVLTIIATIFIPLTFIAGVYGMNFDHMPELHYKYSYFILLGIMVLLFLGLLYYFKRKKWL